MSSENEVLSKTFLFKMKSALIFMYFFVYYFTLCKRKVPHLTGG